MQITWNTEVNAPCCPGEIIAEDGRTVLIQTDWDYPGVAGSFGWSTQLVQHCPECGVVHVDRDDVHSRGYPVEFNCPDCRRLCINPCPHQTTDGTVDCDCGMPAGEFIDAARDWLESNDGATASDPGYFG